MTVFEREILEQPDALLTLVARYSGESAAVFSAATARVRGCRRLVVTGMGTSLHTPYLLSNAFAGQPFSTVFRDAGELLHFGLADIRDGDVLLAVSQSGESAETRAVVGELSGRIPVLSIVNNIDSGMGRDSDIVLPLFAGDEAAISTKTYTNTIAVLELLAGAVTGDDAARVSDGIADTAERMRSAMDATSRIAAEVARHLAGHNVVHVVARGKDLVTARQLALIAKEGAGMFSEALSAGLFRHGPVELAGENHAAVFFVSRDTRPDLTADLARETAGYGSRVVLVSDTGDIDAGRCMRVVLDSAESRFFVLHCAPFIEYFVKEAASLKGLTAGQFSHAVKITDRE